MYPTGKARIVLAMKNAAFYGFNPYNSHTVQNLCYLHASFKRIRK